MGMKDHIVDIRIHDDYAEVRWTVRYVHNLPPELKHTFRSLLYYFEDSSIWTDILPEGPEGSKGALRHSVGPMQDEMRKFIPLSDAAKLLPDNRLKFRLLKVAKNGHRLIKNLRLRESVWK